jgi:hypothetical protein
MTTRRQFFSRMRKLGFKKSDLQMTRTALSYVKEDEGVGRVMVTVPKGHEGTFSIMGDVPYSGIFIEDNGRTVNWGISVDPGALGLSNMLEVCLGLCNNTIRMEPGILD